MSRSQASQAQLAANRLNAQRSTGPRTAEGKAASSQNAVKHALFRTVLVLEDESQEEFDQLLVQVMESYEPQNVAEQLLVEQIVEANWKIRRMQRAERELYARAQAERVASLSRKQRQESRFDSALTTLELIDGSRYQSLARAADRFHGIIARAQRELERLRKVRRQAAKDQAAGLHEPFSLELRPLEAEAPAVLQNEANSDVSEAGTEAYDQPSEPADCTAPADLPSEAGTPGGESHPGTVPQPDLRV